MKRKRTNFPRSFETEIAFVITENSEDIANDIAGITSILVYDLQPRPRLRIVDTYYDTKDGSLRSRKASLRVRKIDGELFLSMKSSPTRLAGRGTRRKELELAWSYPSLARIADELKFKVSVKMRRFSRLTPLEVLMQLGFEVIQERLTKRDARDIIPHRRTAGSRIGELAIDRVTFLHEKVKVRLFDVEIEAKALRSVPIVQEVANALYSLYPDSLLQWPYGKFVTGLAIRRLLETRILEDYLDHNYLNPQAFPLIEQTIRSAKL